jgi:sugar phosphate isomerase/epimerase
LISPFEIGICSWSLKQTGAAEISAAMERLGVGVTQLALSPFWGLPLKQTKAMVEEFLARGVRISAGMIAFAGEDYSNLRTIRATGGLVPDGTARERMELAEFCALVARRLGLAMVSTHVGFVPNAKNDPAGFEKLLARIRAAADAFAKCKLTLLFETGQETAADLRAFLTALERENVGVNFDPANMLLYGKGDPVEAVGVLAPWIKHVHMKDTKLHVPPASGDAWRGKECPLGEGDAKLGEVIGALKRIGYAGPLVIEREAVGVREADVKAGVEFLRACL